MNASIHEPSHQRPSSAEYVGGAVMIMRTVRTAQEQDEEYDAEHAVAISSPGLEEHRVDVKVFHYIEACLNR